MSSSTADFEHPVRRLLSRLLRCSVFTGTLALLLAGTISTFGGDAIAKFHTGNATGVFDRGRVRNSCSCNVTIPTSVPCSGMNSTIISDTDASPSLISMPMSKTRIVSMQPEACNIKIRRWRQRLGNNIVQIISATLIALFLDCNVVMPKEHEFLNTSYVRINLAVTPKSRNIFHPKDYFYGVDFLSRDQHIALSLNWDVALVVLRGRLKIDWSKVVKMSENDCVIHIRSGDIFDPPGSKRVQPSYVQPPLSYYLHIIKERKFQQIVIVAENMKNPCIEALLQLFPAGRIRYKEQSLERDLEVLMSAQNIIGGYGTFIRSLMIFSPNIKHYFHPSYVKKLLLRKDNVNHHPIKLDAYLNLMYPWNNTPEQRKTMLEYDLESEHRT